nr:unnamed protein product [Callosobruchus analis]
MCKHLSILKQLGENVDGWDTLVIYIMSNKLDKVPNMHTFKNFLKNRAQLLESLESKQLGYLKSTDSRPDSRYTHGKPKGSDRLQGKSRSFHVSSPDSGSDSAKFACPNCIQNHSIYYCPEYLKLSVKDRMTRVQRLRLCINCLRASHEAKE